LTVTDTQTAPSILWFATIQCIEGKQDLADLAPKDCFIPAEPVEDEAGQIGEAQKATCEVGGRIDRFRLGAGRLESAGSLNEHDFHVAVGQSAR
jgi:hypothetical protein